MNAVIVEVILRLTVTVILLEIAGVLQGILLVRVQVSTSPVTKLLLVNDALSVPTGSPFRRHWYDGAAPPEVIDVVKVTAWLSHTAPPGFVMVIVHASFAYTFTVNGLEITRQLLMLMSFCCATANRYI